MSCKEIQLIQELDELDELYIYIYIYIYMYMRNMCSELAKSGQKQVIFKKKLVSDWFLPFLTVFCVYMYIYIHKGGSVGNPLTQILLGGP